ncbi:methyltransferase-like protein 27 isoform X2 [Castor canadensis]|uniref:Methyltransferase-like protein 27 isoform X2 n=1 Tax=Castor canadensis TaxID=51338 RepID=A0AC58MR13_CASCN
MAQEEGERLPQVLARVEAAHGITDLTQNLHFYDRWAPDYDQDVTVLQYRAPRLAVDCLTQALPALAPDALILDVACGTGLVASELQARGFLRLHGVDGSPEMLKQAQARGLYQSLSLCTLGQELLPNSEGTFDAVLIVGALSDGQVPCRAIPELLRVTKPELRVEAFLRAGRTHSQRGTRNRCREVMKSGEWQSRRTRRYLLTSGREQKVKRWSGVSDYQDQPIQPSVQGGSGSHSG